MMNPSNFISIRNRSIADSIESEPFTAPTPSLELPSSLPHEPDWSQDSKELYRISLLRTAHRTTLSVPPDEILNLVCQQSYYQGMTPTEGQLIFLQEVYGLDVANLQKGLECEARVREIIQTGKDDFAKGQTELLSFSNEISNDIKALQPGKSFILYGAIAQLSDASNNQIINSLAHSFLPPEWLEHLERRELSSVGDLSDYLIQTLSKPIQDQLEFYFPASADQTIKDILNFGAHSLLPKWFAGGMTEKTLEVVTGSFKAHIKRDLKRSLPSKWHDNFDSFASDIVEFGLQEAIKKELNRTSSSLNTTLSQQMQTMQASVMEKIPEQARLLLNTIGVGSGEDIVWLEIIKEENDNFTLLIHGLGRSLSQHPTETTQEGTKKRVTLRYAHLTSKELSEAFLHKFFTMRAWPAWSKEISFNLSSFYEEALSPLNMYKVRDNGDDCYPDTIASQIKEPWDLLKIKTLRHLNTPPEEGEKEVFFPLQKQTLLALWSKMEAEPKNKEVRNQLERVKQAVVNTALRLHEAQDIDDQELKSVYATAWEIDQKLYGEKVKGINSGEEDQFLINGAVSYQVKKIIESFGGKPHRLEAIQAALIEVFGPSMKEVIEHALAGVASPRESLRSEEDVLDKEITPPLTLQEQVWAAINEVQEWDAWDYIFFAAKAYRAFRYWAFYAGGGIVVNQATEYLHQALLTHVPHYGACALVGNGWVRRMVSLLGVWAIKKILPEKIIPQRVIDGYDAVIRKAESTALYYAILWAIPRVASKSKLEEINRHASHLKQQVSREGSISYTLMNPVQHQEKMSFPAQGFSLPIDSATESGIETKREDCTRALPVPYRVELTSENVRKQLVRWLEESHSIRGIKSDFGLRELLEADLEDLEEISSAAAADKFIRFSTPLYKEYLLRQLENLPLPHRTEKNLWDEVKDPQGIMELLSTLLNDFHYLTRSKKEEERPLIQSLRVYAILDHLSRRCPDSHLQGFSTAPSILYLFLSQRFRAIKNPVLAKQVLALCDYYQIDPKREYTYSDFHKARSESVVEWEFLCGERKELEWVKRQLSQINNALDISGAINHNSEQEEIGISQRVKCKVLNTFDMVSFAGTTYLNVLLEDEGVKKRLSLIGCSENTPRVDQLLHLFQDAPLNESSIPKKSPLFHPDDKRQALLPRSYHLLKISHLIIKSYFFPFKLSYSSNNIKKPLFAILELKVTPPFWGLKTNQSSVKYITPEFPCCGQFLYTPREDWSRHVNQLKYQDKKVDVAVVTEENVLNESAKSLAYFITHDQESIIRLMCLMKKNPKNIFTNSQLPALLSSQLFHLGLLWDQIDRRPEIIVKLGEAFASALRASIDFINTETTPGSTSRVVAELLQIAYHTRALCEEKIPGSWSQFPDLREIFLEELFPVIYSKADFHFFSPLLSLHEGKEPNALTNEQQQEFVHDFCLYAAIVTNKKKQDFDIHLLNPDSIENPILYWEHLSFIEGFLDDPQNRDRRDTLLIEIAKKLPFIEPHLAGEEKLQWKGSYPYYKCGTIPLIFFPTSVDLQTVEESMLQIIKRSVEKLVKRPIGHIYEKGDYYVAPALNLTIDLKENHFLVYKENYRLLSSSDCIFSSSPPDHLISPDSLIWVEMDKESGKPANFISFGDPLEKKSKRFPILSHTIESDSWSISINWSAVEGEGRPKEEVSLSKENHGLSLLTWFTPLDKIKAYRYIDEAGTLCRIELTEYNLAFDIEKEEPNTYLAMCSGMLQGFYIAPLQKVKKLKDYSRFLLLENKEGDKKVILPNARAEQLLSTLLLKSGWGAIGNHPLLKQMIEKRWGTSWDDTETSHFIYDLDSEGRLSTNDPYAIAYLLTHQVSQGNYSAARHSLALLERMGRLAPFSEAIQKIFFPLSCLSVIDSSAAALSLSLSLIALWEENLLLPVETHVKKKEKENRGSKITQMVLLWLATHFSYERYLKRGGEEIRLLSEYQELLILNGLTQKILGLMKDCFLSNSESLQRAVSLIGLEEVATNLMLSTEVANRYRFLKKKHSVIGEADPSKLDIALRILGITNRRDDGSLKKERIEEKNNSKKELRMVVYGHRFDEESHDNQLIIQRNPPDGQKFQRVSQPLVKKRKPITQQPGLLREMVQSLAVEVINPSWNFQKGTDLVAKLDYSSWKDIINLKTPLSHVLSVPLDHQQYTPNQFSKYFLSYYSLATNQIPCFMKAHEAKQEQFQENREKLSVMLSHLHFKGSKREAILIQILQSLTGMKSHGELPSVIDLKRSFNAIGYVTHGSFTIEKYLIKLCDFSLSKSRRQMLFNKVLLERAVDVVIPAGFEMIKNYAYYTTRQHVFQTIAGPLGTAYRLYSWGKAGFCLLDNIRAIYEEEASVRQSRAGRGASDVEWKSKTIPAAISREMKGLDGYYDSLLQKISERYFDAPTALNAPLTTTIPLSEEDDRVAKEHSIHLNQSCKDFDEREKEPSLRTLPKSEEALQDLYHLLEVIYSSFAAQIKIEREELIAYINHPREQKRKDPPTIREAIRRMHNRSTSFAKNEEEFSLNFEEITQLFLMEDEQEWKKKTFLSSEQAVIVQERLYLHFIKVTRLNQMSRSYALAKQAVDAFLKSRGESIVESLLEELAQELQRERAYDVQTLPSRICRAHLAFEAANQRLLWKKQAAQEDRMLLESGKGLVVEMIMGSGKTYASVPTTDYIVADGHQGIINIWARSAAAVSTKQTAEQSYRSFGQGAHFLHFDRSSQMDKNRLFGLLRRLENGIENREQLNMIKESAQSLQLGMILQAAEYLQNLKEHSYADKSHYLEELFYRGRILHKIRKNEVANLDEIHEILNQRSELNYSFGNPSSVKKEWIKTIHQVMRCLLQTKEFREILHLREDQKPINEALYIKEVLPILADRLIDKCFDSLDRSEKEHLTEYLCGCAKEVPSFILKHPDRKTIDLIKGVLSIILPKALQQKPMENFGPSKKGGEYSRPYVACDYPNEQSTIRSPFEGIVKTFLCFLYTRINERQAETLAAKLEIEAETESSKRGTPFRRTHAARLFSKWLPEYELSKWKQIPRDVLQRDLASSDEAVLKYATYTMEGIRYYKKNIKSDSQNFASMFASFYGDTGSLYNHRTYPDGSKILWDHGTQGETKHLMQIKHKVGSVQILEEEKAEQVLNEILDRFFSPGSRKSALIDRGGILRGLDNEGAAAQVLNHLKISRPDIQGVVFYSGADELMIWEASSTKAIPLNESKLSPNQRITIFDQAHTFASDVPQPAEAEAILTLADTKLEEWAQAIWRMRGLRKRQSITVVMGKETRDKISSKAIPTLEEIYAFVVKNEATQLGEDHFQSDRQKIHDVVRRAILDKMYSVFDELDQSKGTGLGIFNRSSSTMSQFLAYFEEFQDFLIVEDSDDPTTLFGGIDAMVDPKELLQHYMAQQFIWVEKSSSFSREEKQAIWMEMKDLANGLYPEKVHTYLQDGEPNHSALDSFGKEQISESSTETENDQQRELDQQLEQQRQQMNPNEKKVRYHWHCPLKWNPEFDHLSLHWLKFVGLNDNKSYLLETLQDAGEALSEISHEIIRKINSNLTKDVPPAPLESEEKKLLQEANVPLYLFKDFLARSKNSESWKKVASAFDPSIFCSHNFAPVLQRGVFGKALDPLTYNSKIVGELLIIERVDDLGNITRNIGMIDHSDVAYWREKLLSSQNSESKVRIGIYQIGLQGLIATSDPSWKDEKLLSDPDFIRCIVQAKFYGRYTSFPDNEALALRKWLKESNPLLMKKAFLELVDSLDFPSIFNGSDLDFIFNELIEDFESE